MDKFKQNLLREHTRIIGATFTMARPLDWWVCLVTCMGRNRLWPGYAAEAKMVDREILVGHD